MPEVAIQANGTITVTLDAREQGMAQMLLADKGPNVLTEVFSLWFKREVEGVMNARFALLSQQDQVDLLTKMQTARQAESRARE